MPGPAIKLEDHSSGATHDYLVAKHPSEYEKRSSCQDQSDFHGDFFFFPQVVFLGCDGALITRRTASSNGTGT
jgi:hypothetical protein